MILELTGKLKEEVAKCETLDEARKKIEQAGVILSDQELDAVAGGMDISASSTAYRKYQFPNKPY